MSSSDSQHRPAAITIPDADVLHDIVSIILSKLPVKSLSRFRCVCRQWHETMNSPTFKTQHMNNLRHGTASTEAVHTCTVIHSYSPSNYTRRFQATRLLTTSDAPHVKTYNIKDHGFRETNRYCLGLDQCQTLLSSSNGLLCMATVPHICFVSDIVIEVCNPATSQCREISSPRFPVEFNLNHILTTLGVGVVFGFGYDPTIDDYKIVFLFQTPPLPVGLIMSLKTNTWRSIDTSSLPDHCHVFGTPLTSSEGVLYWIVNTAEGEMSLNLMILKFNLVEERFELLRSPEKLVDRYHITVINCDYIPLPALSSYKGSLYMFVPQEYYDEVWMPRYERGDIEIWKLESMVDGQKPIWRKQGLIPTFEGETCQPLGFNCGGYVIMKIKKMMTLGRDSEYLYAYLPSEKKYVKFGAIRSDACVHLVQMDTLASP